MFLQEIKKKSEIKAILFFEMKFKFINITSL